MKNWQLKKSCLRLRFWLLPEYFSLGSWNACHALTSKGSRLLPTFGLQTLTLPSSDATISIAKSCPLTHSSAVILLWDSLADLFWHTVVFAPVPQSQILYNKGIILNINEDCRADLLIKRYIYNNLRFLTDVFIASINSKQMPNKITIHGLKKQE